MASSGVYKSESRAVQIAAEKSLKWLSGVLVIRRFDLLTGDPEYYCVQDNIFNRQHQDWQFAVRVERNG